MTFNKSINYAPTALDAAKLRRLLRREALENTLELIRSATNKAWVLGSERFKRQIENQINRRLEPAKRGVERKSEKFREQAKNQTF